MIVVLTRDDSSTGYGVIIVLVPEVTAGLTRDDSSTGHRDDSRTDQR